MAPKQCKRTEGGGRVRRRPREEYDHEGDGQHTGASSVEYGAMSEPVSVCPVHGPYAHAADDRGTEATTCPECGVDGERVLDGRHRERLSKFCSGALRHFPADAGVRLDAAGFTPWDELVAAVERQYDWAGDREVRAVVATDPKGRFETHEDGETTAVRAAYGHSVDVDLDHGREGGTDDRDDNPDRDHDHEIPATLYHGTAPRNLDAIGEEGLRPMGRQAVHLSGSRESALAVGRRHAETPVVLAVDAGGLTAAGFDVRRRGVDTYTVERVPPAFLARSQNV
jgi:putative RNA 2'-phosphotransferase